MKAKMKAILSILLAMSIVVCHCVALANYDRQEKDALVSLDSINSSLTLEDALTQYPEILDLFFIEKITDEEAEKAIDRGVCLIDGSEFLAKDFLSQLNGRKGGSVSLHSSRDIPKNTLRGPYGAAWPYVSKTGTQPNCYGYAIGISYSRAPGYYSTGSVPSGANVSTVASKVISDMAAAFNGGGRIIVSNTSTIYSNEWRVACRTGSGVIYTNGGYYYLWDYHFWLQTASGTWCHKPGQAPSTHLGNVTPHTENWKLGNITNFYNSNTIYLALYSQ